MSPKSLDPLSQRKNDSAGAESTPPVPRGVNATKVLEKAQATVEARKEAQAKSKRRIIFGSLLVGLLLFLIGAVVLVQKSYFDQAQEKDQQKKSAQEESLETLKSWRSYKALSDSDETAFLKEVGPSYIAADLSGFGLSESERDEVSKYLGPSANKTQLASAVTSRINKKLELAKTTGYFEGYLFYFWFGSSIVNKLPQEQIPGWNDSAVLQSDKEYAAAKANEYRSQIKDGSLPAKDLLVMLQSDKRLKLYDEANGSTYFSTALLRPSLEDDGRYESVSNALNQQFAVGVTEVGTIVADPGLPVSGKKREVGYFFLKLEKVLRGQEAINKYQDQLKQTERLAL